MSLRDQMAIDACAILSTEDLGERVDWTSGATTLPRTVRVIEQAERQTVRRAHIWTPIATTAVSVGDTFRLKRGSAVSTWVVLYSDPAETGIQRHYCHEQLTTLVTLTRHRLAGSRSGTRKSVAKTTEQLRAKWFQSSAEIETTEGGRRRRMSGEFYLILQSFPQNLNAADTITDQGRHYRVERIDQDFSREDLPYAILSRSD